MATLNLSSNGPSISSSYQSVVNAPAPSGPAAASPTYGQWAVFAVSAPLVNAFQQNSAQKESVLKVQSTGEGELVDLIEEFSDGRIQFAFVKVKDPNTALPKNVLVAWCGEGVPERTKGYFTSHLAAVSKFLHGYHVQVTARSDRDLTPESIVQKVADSSGSKYSGAVPAPDSSAIKNKPPIASKPAFNPTQTAGSFKPLAGTSRGAGSKVGAVDEDGWGADAPPVTRTQLEKVAPAYQPTKVNMKDLMSQKSATTSTFRSERAGNTSTDDVVKGNYQPVGKVDIAAIRRQARESGNSADERPEPVKGSYEPVGKVDIMAIRSKAQGGDSPRTPSNTISPVVTGTSNGSNEPKSLAERSEAFTPSERLTTLPKPKVSNRFGSGATFSGTKAPLPGGFEAKSPPPAAPIGSASRTFADEGGKTPAQLWAEKKAKQQGGAVNPSPVSSTGPQPAESQEDRQGWKSSYAGKSWAPVQISGAGASVRTPDAKAEDSPSEEPSNDGVGSIRDRFSNAPPMGAAAPASNYERSAPSPPPLDMSNKPTAARAVPIPGLQSQPSEPENTYQDTHQAVPAPPPQPRSPTPESPSPVQPSSPIRVAMPVGRGSADQNVTDVHGEQYSPPVPLPTESLAQSIPKEEDIEEENQATAAAGTNGIYALVQYDYDKTEDNEIDMREGEYVTNIDMVDEDWWLGVNAHGESGLFPGNYVEVIEHDGADQAPAAPPRPDPEPEATQPRGDDIQARGPTATALYDYDITEDNEIGFPEDAKIINIEFPDEDWWLGEYQGKVGLFPANYVQLDE